MAMAAPCQAASAGAGSRRADSRPLRLAPLPAHAGLRFLLAEDEAFRAQRARVHFSCMPKRNRTKEKGTPFPRPAGILPSGYVPAGRAFRRHILCRRKGRHIHVPAPSGLFVRPSPLHRGPKEKSGLLSAIVCAARTRFWRAGCALACPGPLCSGGGLRLHCRASKARPEMLARRGADTMSARFSKAHGCASEKPRKPARTLRTGCPQSAEKGWPLFWFVFSGQTEKMNSRP